MYWSFRFSISPSNKYSGLSSFRIDWFDLPALQRTLKSSPAPEFEAINSLVLCLLYGLTLTSIHDYWKNHSFDYRDFVSKVMSLLSSKEQTSCNFMAAVTIHSDFRAQENKSCHCFNFFAVFGFFFFLNNILIKNLNMVKVHININFIEKHTKTEATIILIWTPRNRSSCWRGRNRPSCRPVIRLNLIFYW